MLARYGFSIGGERGKHAIDKPITGFSMCLSPGTSFTPVPKCQLPCWSLVPLPSLTISTDLSENPDVGPGGSFLPSNLCVR